MGLLSLWNLAGWALLLHYLYNANHAARTGNLAALQHNLCEMQCGFGPLRATPEGRLDLRMLATTAAT